MKRLALKSQPHGNNNNNNNNNNNDPLLIGLQRLQGWQALQRW